MRRSPTSPPRPGCWRAPPARTSCSGGILPPHVPRRAPTTSTWPASRSLSIGSISTATNTPWPPVPRLVHSCGFDSIPRTTMGRVLHRVPVARRPTLSRWPGTSGQRVDLGGTYQSAVNSFARIGAGRAAAKERKRREKPPSIVGPGLCQASRTGCPAESSGPRRLTITTPVVVARSARALPEYGPDFTYSHYARGAACDDAGGAAHSRWAPWSDWPRFLRRSGFDGRACRPAAVRPPRSGPSPGSRCASSGRRARPGSSRRCPDRIRVRRNGGHARRVGHVPGLRRPVGHERAGDDGGGDGAAISSTASSEQAFTFEVLSAPTRTSTDGGA